MPKFISIKTFKLDFLGEEWKDCFLKFSSVSINENKELIKAKLGTKSAEEVVDVTMKFLADHFISGNAYDSDTKQIVAIKAEELGELPSLIQQKVILFLIGGEEV
jgi:hypothetical protein